MDPTLGIQKRRWFYVYPPQFKHYVTKKYLLPNPFSWTQNLFVHQLSWNCCNVQQNTKNKIRMNTIKKNSIYSN